MLFHSFDFLVFLPIVLFLALIAPKKFRNGLLFLASMVFYASGGIVYVLFLLAETLLSYGFGLLCEKYPKKKKTALAAWVVLSLGTLCFFKVGQVQLSLFMPIGLSFYTFSTIGYVTDVYRGTCKAEKNFIDYALFVSFFPYVLSGPIERAGHILPQLKEHKKLSFDNIREGAYRMLWGYFLKLVIADRLALFVGTVYGEYQAYTGTHLLIATVLFAFQLYADFAGYSEIARGAGKLFGIDIVQNFKAPYFSCTVSEFFRRWHISLNRWLIDYLYIPLGGSRKGTVRKYANIMITFLLSGFWHGTGLSFIAWGGLNGVWLVLSDMTKKVRDKCKAFFGVRTDCVSYRLWQMLVTFVAVDLAWLFFRADSLKVALGILYKIVFSLSSVSLIDRSLLTMGLDLYDWLLLAAAGCIWLLVDILREKGGLYAGLLRQNLLFRYLLFLVGFFGILVFGVYGTDLSTGSFLYFQF